MLHAPAAVSPIALQRFILRLSQADLASRAGLSRDTVSRLERGELPRLNTARALSGVLGLSVDALFPTNEEGAPPASVTPSDSPGGGDAGNVLVER